MEKTIVIQSGGASSRMGRDKGLILFRGEPLVVRICHRLSPLSNQFLLVTNRPEEYAFTGLPVTCDVLPGVGALGGLLTALERADTPLIAVTACDMPFVSRELFELEFGRLEAEGVDVVVPSSPAGLEPFHAVYRRESCLAAVRGALERGERKVISWFPDVKVRVLPVDEALMVDASLKMFLNINTAEELAAAENSARMEGPG